jgi:dTMP kinase
LLVRQLATLGRKCIYTKEPFSVELRSVISFYSGISSLQPIALALLIAADRCLHVKYILTYLTRGFDVVSDRYYPSSLVYQVIQGVPRPFISRINQYAPTPDLLFMIDTSLKTRIERTLKRREVRPDDFFRTPRVMKKEQKLYDKLMREWANRPNVRILAGSKSKEQLSKDVLNLTLSVVRSAVQ